ncbi:MAG TPA: hypothetical protein VJ725_32365, partial [Thermoanaerobaculia bacterium]|nr:hypothetical protein [Thermoanaerobaculia bacterium]
HPGLADPHGVLNGVARQGSSFTLDFLYPVRPQLAWDLRLGVLRFDGRGANPDTDVWNLGVNAKFTINPAAPVRFFLMGGPDLYHFDPGDFEGGANLGVGLGVPAGTRFTLEATYNYHWTLTASPDLEFSQIELGLLVSF